MEPYPFHPSYKSLSFSQVKASFQFGVRIISKKSIVWSFVVCVWGRIVCLGVIWDYRERGLKTSIVGVVHDVLTELWELGYLRGDQQCQGIACNLFLIYINETIDWFPTWSVILHLYGLMFLDLLSWLNTLLYAIMFVVCCCLLVSGVRRKETKDRWSEEAGSSRSRIVF